MIRFLDGPAAAKFLILRRAPLYLRVVYDSFNRKWDALDQLNDQAAAGETIVVYRRVGEARAGFVDWTERGRRRGGYSAIASYSLVAEQPDDATVRDTTKWRAWCCEQLKRDAKAEPS